MVNKELLVAVTKGLVACVLGVVLLWQIAECAGPQTSEVVVHVTESPVVVTIDGQSYTVATWRDSPLVCELRWGRHELRMWRGDRLIYQESFHVRPGDNIVLTAWEPRPKLTACSTHRVSATPVLGINADGDDPRGIPSRLSPEDRGPTMSIEGSRSMRYDQMGLDRPTR